MLGVEEAEDEILEVTETVFDTALVCKVANGSTADEETNVKKELEPVVEKVPICELATTVVELLSRSVVFEAAELGSAT